MDHYIKEENGNYKCQKHNEIIKMIVLDDNVMPQDQLLCLICLEQNRQILKHIIGIDQAKEVIKERLISFHQGKEGEMNRLFQKLDNFQKKLRELRTSTLKTIDDIIRNVESWMKELHNCLNPNQDLDLVEGLKYLSQSQQQVNHQIDQNEKAFLVKINGAFRKLITIIEFQKCFEELQNLQPIHKKYTKRKVNEQTNLPIYEKNLSVQAIQQPYVQITYKLIKKIQQNRECKAIDFNNNNSVMISGANRNIKVWQFADGKLIKLTELERSSNAGDVTSLIFSKKNQWFVSGDSEGYIQLFKQGKDTLNWLTNDDQNMHNNNVNCLLLNKKEDQLISCSECSSCIVVWKIDYEINEIIFDYKIGDQLEKELAGISLNEQEDKLISWTNFNINLLIKGDDDKWQFKNSIEMPEHISRICLIDENQILVQLNSFRYTDVLTITNDQFIEQQDQKIKLTYQQEEDDCQFQTIYNKRRGVIIQKLSEKLYLIKREPNGQFKVMVESINCKTLIQCGKITGDGEHLIIWKGNKQQKKFKIYKLIYQ